MIKIIIKIRSIINKKYINPTFSQKMFISGILSSAEHFISVIIRILSTLIITRLLAPEIFGIFAIIMAFQTILSLCTDFGVRSFIITSKITPDQEFLRTCWSVQVIRGFVIYGVILALSGLLLLLQQGGALSGDSVYGSAALPAALAVSGFQMVLQGFWSVNQHVYAREMRFRLITILGIIQAIVAPVLTILIALVHPTIWALVISGLAGATLTLFLTHYLFDGPRMGFCWNRRYRSELFNRGKWIMGRSSLTVATNQADSLLLSAFIPAPLFGVYFLAKQIFGVPDALVQKLHSSFGLQFFREIVDLPGKEQMHARYYKYRMPMDALTCIFAGGFLTAAPAVIDLMYDPRYQDAGYILQILGIGLPLFGIGMVREAYGAQQRFKITAALGLIRTATIWAGMLTALIVFESPLAAFLVIALHRIPELAVTLYFARREGWIDLLKEIRMFPLIGVGALMGWGLSELIGLVTA